MDKKLKIVFLVGSDSAATRLCVEQVCLLQGVQSAAVLIDHERVSAKRRFKNLARNVRANGWKYVFVRQFAMFRALTDYAVKNTAVSSAKVMSVLKKAFPDHCFSLAELGKKYDFAIHSVGNLNGGRAVQMLGECRADLGIVLGTRILKPSTFGIPRMGCINLHKGKVPEYRGMPPGFWELYDGALVAGVTVHFVDKGLDTGDIVATSEVSILPTDTPNTLEEKLHTQGAQLLASAVSLIRDGKAVLQTQGRLSVKPKTKPIHRDVAFLRRKLPHWKSQSNGSTIGKNLYLLSVYFTGLYSLIRLVHRWQRSRGAIYLYHRVNDYSKDVLTVDIETFAAQLLAISKKYRFSTTVALANRIRSNKAIAPTTVAIHFDDCYRDILTNGAPIMKVLGVPATAFINSGFIDTERSFQHDLEKTPFAYPNLRSCDVQDWTDLGFEVGAHTVNHVDLGKCTLEAAKSEIVQCGESLRKLIGKPVELFSFPFGQVDNITGPTKQIISAVGYVALFSAHGGFIGTRTDPYDIPRMGASYRSSPLYLLLELEGLAPGQIASAFRSIMSRFRRANMETAARKQI